MQERVDMILKVQSITKHFFMKGKQIVLIKVVYKKLFVV